MNHIEITTMLPCVNRCSYCPQALLAEMYGGKAKLDLETFKLMLKNIPQDVEIHFSAFSEPFGNRESSQMMAWASNQGYTIVVYSTLNGITKEDIEIIKDIPFKEFNVHLIGIDRPELPFTHNTISVENPISRAGNLFPIAETDRTKCSRNSEFKQNVVLPNGDLYLCCMDYGLKHKLGNILEENYNDIKRETNYELCKSCEVAV